MTLTRLQSIAAERNLPIFVNAKKANNFTFAKLCFCEKELKKAINSKLYLRACIINKNVALVEYKH